MPFGRRKMQDEPRRTVEGVADRSKIEFAREQRKNPTRAEKMLWQAVRRKRLGVRIRRQHPIGDFVLDFYCAEARLAIEVDGPVHEQRQAYDRWRDQTLATWGIEVMRVPEERVREELTVVVKEIRDRLGQQRPGPGSPPDTADCERRASGPQMRSGGESNTQSRGRS